MTRRVSGRGRPYRPIARASGSGHEKTPGRAQGFLAELTLTAQWKESPQAQEFCALGLSIVKPCFSMVSTKSITAPSR